MRVVHPELNFPEPEDLGGDPVVPRTLLCYIRVRDTCILRGGHIYCPMF